MLKLKNITKSYGEFTALNDVSFSMQKGTILGLLGPNGAGKTTLMRILNQIILPDLGEIYLDGKKLNANDVCSVGYLPEERGLYKSMKVGEQVIYLARLKGVSKQEAKSRMIYWFEKFEIMDLVDKGIQELSKGMAQKVQFIIAVVHNPKLIILDEPFSGFDPLNSEIIAREIIDLKARGAAVILSTHRMESVEEMCDRIVLFNNSKIIFEGSPIDLEKKYKTDIYEIGIRTEKMVALKSHLDLYYEYEEIVTDLSKDNQILRVRLKEKDLTGELLSRIMTYAEILFFSEIKLTMRAIFMNLISNQSIA